MLGVLDGAVLTIPILSYGLLPAVTLALTLVISVIDPLAAGAM